MWFEMISKVKINLEKSGLIPIRGLTNVEGLASMLSRIVGKLPTT